jgi:hypothetical protein
MRNGYRWSWEDCDERLRHYGKLAGVRAIVGGEKVRSLGESLIAVSGAVGVGWESIAQALDFEWR